MACRYDSGRAGSRSRAEGCQIFRHQDVIFCQDTASRSGRLPVKTLTAAATAPRLRCRSGAKH